MPNILIKSRTGQEITLQPVGLSPTALSEDNFGLDPYALAKIARSGGADALEKRGKRADKMRKALWHESVPTDLRNKVIDFAHKVERQSMTANDGPQPPGARGGSAISKERGALVGDIMSRGDIADKIQNRLVQLVYDAAPISLISAQAAHEGAEPYPASDVYLGK